MVTHILHKVINLDKLIKEQPELFHLDKLGARDKVALLNNNPMFYADKISLDNMPFDDKVYIKRNVQKSIADKITITDKELAKLSPTKYGCLLIDDFKWARPDLFKKLSSRDKQGLFIENPDWVYDNCPNDVPKLSPGVLERVAELDPKFVDKCIDLTNCLSNAYCWNRMISYNESKYLALFISNTKALVTKTDVRIICRRNPEVIKLLTPEILNNSKLSVKEWILLCNEVILNEPSEFKNWKFSQEMIDIFKLDLTSELLNGKSRNSKQLTNSMGRIFSTKDLEETIDDK